MLAAVLVIVMLFASWVLRPHVLQNSEKTSTYECGEEPIGPARVSFPYNYLTYTILFLVVDVLGAFLWLLSSSSLRFTEITVWQFILFTGIFMVGIWYVIKRLPETYLSGSETVELYQKARASSKSSSAHEEA